MPRLLDLLPALGRKASTFQPCVLLPRGAEQRLVTPVSNNTTMAYLSADATGATNASDACSLSYCKSACCGWVGGLSSEHDRSAVTSSGVLFALCLLHTQLERLGHYFIRGGLPACWTWHMGRRGRTSTQYSGVYTYSTYEQNHPSRLR
jgi:hypothetical protein